MLFEAEHNPEPSNHSAYTRMIERTTRKCLGVYGAKSEVLISRDARTRLDAGIVIRGRRETRAETVVMRSLCVEPGLVFSVMDT